MCFILPTFSHSVVIFDDKTECITNILMKSSNGDSGKVKQYEKLAYWKADNGGSRSANEDHTKLESTHMKWIFKN